MDMQKQEIEIPKEVPVMTIGGMVLFPQAVMPLHIFEPRYQEMLGECAGQRPDICSRRSR